MNGLQKGKAPGGCDAKGQEKCGLSQRALYTPRRAGALPALKRSLVHAREPALRERLAAAVASLEGRPDSRRKQIELLKQRSGQRLRRLFNVLSRTQYRSS